MITPNAALPIISGVSKINQVKLEDMTWEIKLNAIINTEQTFEPFKDVYNQFCGTIDYTLKYVNGVPNNKDLGLITYD
jgi:hypothetical protein